MKLRNKKTGGIIELKVIQVNDKYLEDHEVNFLNGEKLTLELLTNSFDDVKESFIKDEKIRKAVRIWAEVNGATGATELRYYEDENCLKDLFRNEIHFNQLLGLEDDKTYTVTELCGEAEE